MRRAGFFLLLVVVIAGLVAMGRVVMTASGKWPPAIVITRGKNPAPGMKSVAETLPLTETEIETVSKNEWENLWEDADFLTLAPDERLEVLAKEVLRLMYEVDGQEPEQARMLDMISKYVTKPYFDYYSQVYSERLMNHQRKFLGFELAEIRDETVRDAWGEYRATRNVFARIHIDHDGRFFWIGVQCVFKETGEGYPPNELMDQVFYIMAE
jgi:hypothetical protein